MQCSLLNFNFTHKDNHNTKKKKNWVAELWKFQYLVSSIIQLYDSGLISLVLSRNQVLKWYLTWKKLSGRPLINYLAIPIVQSVEEYSLEAILPNKPSAISLGFLIKIKIIIKNSSDKCKEETKN